MSFTVVKAELEHCNPIASDMRESDRMEVWQSNGRDPLSAITESLGCSPLHCCTMMWHNEPVGMFGVGYRNGIGSPWLLATTSFPQWKRHLVRITKPHTTEWHIRYPILVNFTSLENGMSLKWLKYGGFAIHDDVIHEGRNGGRFVMFTGGYWLQELELPARRQAVIRACYLGNPDNQQD